MFDEIEVPEDLSGLSVEDLQALLDQINEAGDATAAAARDAKQGSDERKELVSTLEKLKEAKARVSAAHEVAVANEAAEQAAIDEAAAEFGGDEEETEETEETASEEATEETETPAEEEAAPAEETAEAEATEEVPIAASATKMRVPARRRRRGIPEAEKDQSDKYAGLLSHGDDPITSMKHLSDLFKRADNAAPMNGDGMARVATMHRFPGNDESRIVQGPDAVRNTKIMRDADVDAAIMAAGGFCGPGDVIREIETCGRTDRPVGSSIPTINARGEYQFSRPVSLSDVEAGVAYWTETDDLAVVDATEGTWKPCYSLTCGVTVTALPIAIPACFSYGTFQQWSRPEQIQAALNLFDVALARKSEALVLQRIHELSNQYTYTPPVGETAQNALIRMVAQLLDLATNGRNTMDGYVLTVPESLINQIIVDAAIKAWVGPTLTRSQIVGQLEDLFGVMVETTPDWRANAPAPVEPLPAAPLPAGASAIPCPHTVKEVLLWKPSDFRHGVDDVDIVVQTDIATARKNNKSVFLETIETTEKFGCSASFSVLWDGIRSDGSQPDLVAADTDYCEGPTPDPYAGETPVGFPGGPSSAL